MFAGLFIGTILCGFLADLYGRRAIFTWSLLWYSAANIMVALQSDAFGLNAWRFVSGVGLGLEMVTIGAYVSELAPKRLRGRAFAVNQAIGFTCVPIISALAYMLVPAAPLGIEGWRWVVLIGALAAPVVVFLRRSLPESPRWLAKHGRLDEADHALRRIEARSKANTGSRCRRPASTNRSRRRAGSCDLWVPGVRGRVILMSVFNVFQTIGFYGFSNWVPSLLVKQGITVSTSLGYTTIIALAAPVGPLIGFFLGDRFERKWIIVAAAGVILCCGLVFGQAREAALIIAMGVALTLGNNVMSYSFHAYQQELFPTGDQGARRRLRLFLEPPLGHLQLLRHRLRAGRLWRAGRVRLHRRRDGRRDGDDRAFRPAHDQPGAGEDRPLTRLRGGSSLPPRARFHQIRLRTYAAIARLHAGR